MQWYFHARQKEKNHKKLMVCYLIIFHDHNRLKLREDKRPVINESIIFNSPGTAHFGENIGNMPAPDLCRQFELLLQGDRPNQP